MSSPAYLSLSHQLLHHFILLLDYLTTCGIALCMVANVGSYTQGRIAGDFLSSRKTARAERCTPKTTAAALDG